MKIKLFLFILLLSIFLEKLSAAAQPIFTKTTPTFEVTMTLVEDSKANKTIWNIFLQKGKKKILLEKITDKFFTKEQQRYRGSVKKYVIIGDVTVVDNMIYMMVRKIDEIYFIKYTVLEHGKVLKHACLLEKIVGYSYMNFGSPRFHSEMKRLSSNEIWITWNSHRLLRINLPTNDVHRITFVDYAEIKSHNGMFVEKKRDEVLYESIQGILPFNLEKDSLIVYNELKNVLKDKIKAPLVYIGFLDDMSTTRDMNVQKENAEEDKRESGTDYEPVEIEKLEGETYFFYKDPTIPATRIIRYNHNEKAWRIGKYKEIEIKAQ